jgi:hypothetical protein
MARVKAESEQIWVKSKWTVEELDKQRIEFDLLLKDGGSASGVGEIWAMSRPPIDDLERMPLDFAFYDQQSFIPWQGEVSALLGYNPKLQSDFQGAVNAIESQNPFDTDNLDTMASLQRPNTVIRRILAQAISELALPEELLKQTAPTEFQLTNEHGILWFVTHCTWSVRWTLLSLIIGAALTVFGIGFRIGMMDAVRNLYIQYNSLPTPAPTNPPMNAQPNK